jgi:hypothetical protein
MALCKVTCIMAENTYVSQSVQRLGYELDDRGMRFDSQQGKGIFSST